MRKKIDRYKILDILGRGGMAEVFLAEDPALFRKLAIKVILIDDELGPAIREDYLNRFKVEARASAKLSHPSIVGVYDTGEEEGLPWIAFEYVDGKSLDKILTQEGKIDVPQAISIAVDVASALKHAHEQGIFHRDVKPSNIMIAKSGVTKLSDFGVAKAPWTSPTTTGATVGSPGYMSPEQIKGLELDTRTDLFSLGVVLYEMISGCHPFMRDNISGTLLATINGHYKPLKELLSDLPQRLEYEISRCMAVNRDFRIGSASEFIDVFSKIETLPQAPVSQTARPVVVDTRSKSELATRITQKDNLPEFVEPASPPLARQIIFSGIGKFKKGLFVLIVLVILSLSITSSQFYKGKLDQWVIIKKSESIQELQNQVTEGSFKEAFRAARKLRQRGHDFPKDRFIDEFNTYLHKDDFSSAAYIADQYLKIDRIMGYVLQGRLALKRGKYDRASRFFTTTRKSEYGATILNEGLHDILGDMVPVLEKDRAPDVLNKLIIETLNAAHHEQIKEWLKSEKYWLRWNAVTVLKTAELPVDLVAVYILDLKESNVGIREKAVKELGNLGDTSAIPALQHVSANRHSDPVVAQLAASVLDRVFDIKTENAPEQR